MSRPNYLKAIFKLVLCLCVLITVIVLKLTSNKYNFDVIRSMYLEVKNTLAENQSFVNKWRIKNDASFEVVPKPTSPTLTTSFEASPTVGSPNATFSKVQKKVILLWHKWFKKQWSARFPDQEVLEDTRCPSFHCVFTYDQNRLQEADAILFVRSNLPNISRVNNPRRSSQRWIIVDVEAPTSVKYEAEIQYEAALNWTATYHSSADFLAFYGYFNPLNYTVRSLRPNIMEYESDTMKAYLSRVHSGRKTTEHLDDFLPSLGLPSITSRKRTAAWMSSHCPTDSHRELLVDRLQHLIKIDTYGSCGKLKCGGRSPYGAECWQKNLSQKYFFYLSFENKLCDEYITEKLYNPLHYGLVPVVYGGANYSQFLPPHSFIDASQYTPDDLGKLMLKIQGNPSLYLRYHLWRKHWKVQVGGSFCELCHKLETKTEISQLVNFGQFRNKNENCYPPKI